MEAERIEDQQHNALGFGPTDQEHLAAVGRGQGDVGAEPNGSEPHWSRLDPAFSTPSNPP